MCVCVCVVWRRALRHYSNNCTDSLLDPKWNANSDMDFVFFISTHDTNGCLMKIE